MLSLLVSVPGRIRLKLLLALDRAIDLPRRDHPVQFFAGFRFPRLGFQVSVDFPPIGVVVGESRMNLRQRQVAKLPRDFFRNQALVVPLGVSGFRSLSPN
jgi:hypothetical protein